MTVPTGSSVSPSRAHPKRAIGGRPRPIDVLVCGSQDRRDDGAALAIVPQLRTRIPGATRLRVVGQLGIDDLLAVPRDGGVVIVDAASGLRPGQIVELPLDGLVDRADELRPRSSHALAFREVLGVATLLRRLPLPGRIVAIGGARWSLGSDLSPRVAKALPDLIAGVLAAIEHVRG
jgi:hydrogenase maturation protease